MGADLPLVILANDQGTRFFVKIKDHYQIAATDGPKRKELVNEFVCSGLAKKLGIRCPGEVCCISEDARNQAKAQYDEHLKGANQFAISPRPHFASKEIARPEGSNEVSSALEGNSNELAKLAVFEWALVNNPDLQNNNILLDSDKNLWLIDHGNCFGGSGWHQDTLTTDSESSPEDLLNKFRDDILSRFSEVQFSCARKTFEIAMAGDLLSTAVNEILTTVDDDAIKGLVASVPNEWFTTFEERQALEMFLKCRRSKLNELVKLWTSCS